MALVTAVLPNGQTLTFFRPIIKEGDRTVTSFFSAKLNPDFLASTIPEESGESISGFQYSRRVPLTELPEFTYILRKTLVSGEIVLPFSNSLSNVSSWFLAFGPIRNTWNPSLPEYPDFFGFSDSHPVQPLPPTRRGTLQKFQISENSLRIDPKTGIFSGTSLKPWVFGDTTRMVRFPLRGILYWDEAIFFRGFVTNQWGTEQINFRLAPSTPD
jgi:hypothetical protein